MKANLKTIRWMVPVMLVGVSLAAQSQKADPPAPQPIILDAAVRGQVRLFEHAIEKTVERAGQRLAEWADSIVGAGGIYLVPAAPPKVTGLLLPNDSLAFDLLLAEMNVTGFNMLLAQRPPDSNAKLTATGVVKPDPASGPSKSPVVNPNQQYSDFVRDALITVLVDNGAMLPVTGDQWVTIQVTPIDVLVRNPNYFNNSRRLTLSLRGADLDAFRAKTLTRDELRARVVDRRY